MNRAPPNAWLPPIANTTEGRLRRVGIELEFAGITHTETTDVVAAWAEQPAKYHSLVEAVVEHDSLGEFEIEVDWRYLKQLAQEQQIAEGSEGWVKLLREAARLIVPIEVVAPPIALDQLPQLEFLIDKLRQAGAQGTRDSPISAYGLHINAEIPALTAEVVTPYIQAFVLMQWWLVEKHQVDLTRRLSTYIGLYPDAYVNLVLGYTRAPSMDRLVEDYFQHNPTRNRALDMWPLFAECAPDKVEDLMHEPLIKPRPAFHYRLPNCDIDEPHWRLWNEWQAWLALEKLASDADGLRRLIDKYFSVKRPWLGVNKHRWTKIIEQWLING